MVVCGCERIAKRVMAAGELDEFRSTIDNNDAGIRTAAFFGGSLKMLAGNRWAIRFEDGLEYIVRSRIPSTDLDEGIHCDPRELPAPWRFVLLEHYQPPAGRRGHPSAARLEEIHDEKSEEYIASGVIPRACEKTYVRAGMH